MRYTRSLSVSLVFALLGGLVAVLPPLPAAAAEPGLSPVPSSPSAPVSAAALPSMPAWVPEPVVWPGGGEGQIVVAGAVSRLGGPAAVGGLTVSVVADPAAAGVQGAVVQAAGPDVAGDVVSVRVLSQAETTATGVRGVVFSAGAAADLGGAVGLSVSYAGFSQAYGAGWGGRLRLVKLPGCALTTPADALCRVQTEVAGWVNDPVGSTVSAPVVLPVLGGPSQVGPGPSAVSASQPAADPVPAQVFALTAGGSSESGDFTVSQLSQGASWAHGGSSGDYTMSIPVKVPPTPGVAPQVSFNYSSGGVDGLTKSTNNQSSVLGEGWSLGGVSFVERSYRPCVDDGGPVWSGDLCFVGFAPLQVVLDGQSSQIIAVGPAQYAAEDASLGWLVERLTGAGNGVYDGEHFRITTMDGTRYWFGSRDRAAGGGAARTVVFGNDAGEPCHHPSHAFNISGCTDMGYRWGLDFVEDRFGNSMVYKWAHYTSKYGAVNNGIALEYDISSRLDSIEFGGNTRTGTAAAGMVSFTYKYRCFYPDSECETVSAASHWPDTPWDQFCHWNATSCEGRISPTFWHIYRLEKVESSVWDQVGGWTLVDQVNQGWAFPATGDLISPAGDDTPPSLWLQWVKRQAGEFVAVFGGERLANRVFWGNDLARSPMNHYRISAVAYPAGGYTTVAYTPQECTRTNVYDGASDRNPLRCFPQWEDDQFRWYHKYVVASVTDEDRLGGSPPVSTRYSYTTDHVSSPHGPEYASALWHFDAGWHTPIAKRAFSQWRGYPTVYTRIGSADGSGMQTLSQNIYFRGMNNDRQGGVWNARQVNVDDGVTGSYPDHEGHTGKLIRATTFDAGTGTWRDMQVTKYQTLFAAEQYTGGNPPSFKAWRVLPSQQLTLLNTPGYTRTSTVNTTWDTAFPIVTQVEDLGETAATSNPAGSADDTCTKTSYVPADASRWLIGLPKDTITTKTCAASPPTADYLARQRTYYDSLPLGQLGAGAGMGKVTKTEALHKATASPPAVSDWQNMGTTTAFDLTGRALTTVDAAGRSTVTAYTPAANVRGAVKTVATTVTGTDSLSLGTATTEVDIRFGVPGKVTDINGKITRAEYDWHGYLTKVWKNHRAPASTTGITPDAEYRYVLRADKPSYVATKTLAPNGTSQLPESFSYLDGMLRPRRTETLSADGTGRAVADTMYGTAGQVTLNRAGWVTGNPNANFDTWNPATAPQETRYGYNSFGEQTSAAPYSMGAALGTSWNTTTVTDGRVTTVTPPSGGTITTSITNAQGKTAELRQAKPGGGTLNTVYTYDRAGQLSKVTDPLGNQWAYTYDLLGRKTASTDPDAGTSTTTYTPDGLVQSTTDAETKTLWNVYDSLGRKTGLRDTSATGTVRSEWEYDPAGAKGQLKSTTRKDASGDYKTTISSYNNAYQPTQTTFTAPGFGLGGSQLSYTTTHTYLPSYLPQTTILPAAGKLSEETLTTGYHATTGLPVTLDTSGYGGTKLVAATTYQYNGQILGRTHGNPGIQVKTASQYQQSTGRLSKLATSTETAGTFTEKHAADYAYDQAGNITNIGTFTNTVRDQVECFQYDTLRRLTQAWSQGSYGAGCTPQKTGPDAYWRTWAIDDIGNRTSQVDKNADGTNGSTWTHQNGTAGGVKAHQVKQITATGPLAGTPTRTYGYDSAGNMTSRTTDTGTPQTLEWDKENHLATVKEGTTPVASYVYNTDGSRLLAVNGTTKTLYLPDGTELEKLGTADPLGQRYLGGVAVRNNTGLQWTISNHQGTAIAQIDSVTLAVTPRRMMPYGEPRGPQPTWLGTKGYVGGTKDAPTGLTHLGAREYDPTTGRFISVDPIMDLADPQQWHPYTYSNNSPVTFSDPSGLRNQELDSGGPGGCSTLETCRKIDYGPPARKKITGQTLNMNERSKFGGGDKHGWERGIDNIANGMFDPFVNVYDKFNDEGVLAGLQATQELVRDIAIAGSIVGLAMFVDSEIEAGVGLGTAIYNGDMDKAAEIGTEQAFIIGTMYFGIRGTKGCNSFDPSTLVLLANGLTKQIKDVQVGDLVIATDPETGETGARPVTALIAGEGSKRLVELKIRTADGDASIIATAEHPFWSEDQQRWINATDLDPDTKLRTPTGGVTTVIAARDFQDWKEVNNLTVADLHTYYVLAGKTPVLVHNSGPCDIDPSTPTGSKGNPLLTRTPNQPGTINGRDYTGHALDRMQQQGIMPSVVENAIRGPAIPGKRPGTTAFYDADNHITVITDSASGRVVTVDYGNIKQ